jgi:hypothetical protein
MGIILILLSLPGAPTIVELPPLDRAYAPVPVSTDEKIDLFFVSTK